MLNLHEFSYFLEWERPQNCILINWVINYHSGSAKFQLMTYFMLLDGHLDTYVNTLRS